MADRNLANITDAPSAITVSRSEFEVMRQQAADLIASGYLPKAIDRPEKAVAIIMLGRELGMGPWQSFNSIDVIQGRPTLKPVGMAALVNRFVESRGGYLRVVESTSTICTVEYHRPPSPEARRVSFTVDEAKAANLMGKDTWRQYPTDMLRSRAISRACREGFSDVILGLYTDEEVGGIGDAPRPAQTATTTVRAITTQPDMNQSTVEYDIEDGHYHTLPPMSPEVAQNIRDNQHSSNRQAKEDDRDIANRRYFAVATGRGFTDEANKLLALAMCPERENGVATTSRTQLTAGELTTLAEMVENETEQAYDDEGDPIPLPDPHVEYANKIAAATNQKQLAEIGARMGTDGLGTDWLRRMYKHLHKQLPAATETQPTIAATQGSAGSDRFTK